MMPSLPILPQGGFPQPMQHPYPSSDMPYPGYPYSSSTTNYPMPGYGAGYNSPTPYPPVSFIHHSYPFI